MYKVVKENKEYTIAENQLNSYLAMGFDAYKDGKLYKKSPLSKVSYGEYEKVIKENKKLKEEIKSLKESAKK